MNLPRRSLALASFLAVALSWTGATAAPLAYVPNEKSATLSVIDTATGAVVRELAAGKRPRGIAAGRAGSTLFVTDAGSSVLLALDAATGAPLASIALGKSTRSM